MTQHPTSPTEHLDHITKNTLEAGYAAAADNRHTRPTMRHAVATLTIAAILGLSTTTAIIHLQAPQPAVADAHQLLVDKVINRSQAAENLAQQSVTLAVEVERLEQAGMLPEHLLNINKLDKLAHGSSAVTGPGVVVTITDDQSAQQGSPTVDDHYVWDTDLQFVVNALWASGAEAISVDGQRLTSLSAIRSAGRAILVDLQPLNGPTYRIEAIGDPEKLMVEFARSHGPAYLQVLETQGIQSNVTSQNSLHLPAGPPHTLRHAGVVHPSDDNTTPRKEGA